MLNILVFIKYFYFFSKAVNSVKYLPGIKA
jgi:hypothetical protein